MRGLQDYIDFRSQSITGARCCVSSRPSSHAPLRHRATLYFSSAESTGRMSRRAASPHGRFLEIAAPSRHAARGRLNVEQSLSRHVRNCAASLWPGACAWRGRASRWGRDDGQDDGRTPLIANPCRSATLSPTLSPDPPSRVASHGAHASLGTGVGLHARSWRIAIPSMRPYYAVPSRSWALKRRPSPWVSVAGKLEIGR